MYLPPITPLIDISHINMTQFNVEGQYFGYIYPLFTEQEILVSFLREITYYKLPDHVFKLFVEAWNSRFWVKKGYDGATRIKNKKHTAVCNFIHDYQYRDGMGGIEADVIYKYLLSLTGYTTFTQNTRFVVIRTAWLTYYKYKHLFANNVNPLTDNIKTTYAVAKKHI